MNNSLLIDTIKNNYDIEVKQVIKVKNSYKVICKEGIYALKIIKYTFPHFIFILTAILYLQKQGFKSIPKIIKSNKGLDFIQIDNKYAYLSEWILGRVSNYSDENDLKKASRKLAELHLCSRGFNINSEMKPRIAWFSWIKVFETRTREILDFQNRISQKAYLSEFDKLYLSKIHQEILRANESINRLKKSSYYKVMREQVFKREFCHHDYANHNIIVDNNGDLNVIDFDYCILDTHLHDLSSLLIRVMKEKRWGEDKLNIIIGEYEKIISVNYEERDIIREFIRFPQAFWQIGIQAYWEQQPWEEEVFINKLTKYLDDVKYREEFLKNF